MTSLGLINGSLCIEHTQAHVIISISQPCCANSKIQLTESQENVKTPNQQVQFNWFMQIWHQEAIKSTSAFNGDSI